MEGMELTTALSELERREEAYVASRQIYIDSLPEEIRKQIEPVRRVGALTKFTANGNTYVLREELTLTRYEEFERLQIHVSYGIEYQSLFGNLRKAWDQINANHFGEAAVTIHNILSGAAQNLDKRESPVLMLCTLFISREGEDLRTWDAALASDKIEDWRKEGIAMDDFFALAFASVRNLVPDFAGTSPGFSGTNPSTTGAKESVQKGN